MSLSRNLPFTNKSRLTRSPVPKMLRFFGVKTEATKPDIPSGNSKFFLCACSICERFSSIKGSLKLFNDHKYWVLSDKSLTSSRVIKSSLIYILKDVSISEHRKYSAVIFFKK